MVGKKAGHQGNEKWTTVVPGKAAAEHLQSNGNIKYGQKFARK